LYLGLILQTSKIIFENLNLVESNHYQK